MRKITIVLLLILLTLGCISTKATYPRDLDFPLKKGLTISVRENIQRIAVTNTWMAIATPNHIIAYKMENGQKLWDIQFSADIYSNFQISNNKLVAASQDRIILVGMTGDIMQLGLQEERDEINIVKLVAVYDNYLYVIRGSNWRLEVYDVVKDRLLWQAVVGRGGGDGIYYDKSSNVVFVSGGPLRAFDNATGKLLWKREGNSTLSFLDRETWYIYEDLIVRDRYDLIAIDINTQNQLWKVELVTSAANTVNAITMAGNSLVISAGSKIIAFDRYGGKKLWETNVEEELRSTPVEVEGILYVKTAPGSIVYAISLYDGKIIGSVKIERTNPFSTVDPFGGVYKIENAIVFNSQHMVAVYK